MVLLRKLPAILLILLVTTSNAQSVQSIHNKYRPQLDTIHNDTARIKKLIWYIYEMMQVSPDTALPLLVKAETESAHFNYSYGIAKAKCYRAEYAIANNAHEQALKYFQEALDIFIRIDQLHEAGYQHNNIGIIYNYQGRMGESADAFLKAASFFEQVKDSSSLSVIYNGLGVTLLGLKQFTKANEYFGKSVNIATAQKDTSRLLTVLLNKSMVYGELNNWNNSFPELYQAMQLSDITNKLESRALSRQNLAIAYSHIKQFDSSRYYFRQAEPLSIKAGNAGHLASLYQGIAQDGIFNKSYVHARDMAIKSLEYAKKSNDPDIQGQAYAILSEAYEGLGLFKQSLETYKQSAALSDSVRNLETTNQVNMLETRFRTLQKDKELSDKMLALEQQKIALRKKDFYIFIIGGALLLLLSAALLVYRNVHQQQKIQQQQLIVLQKEHELEATQAMMEGEEKERSRIARNLHDGAGSMLSAARLYIGALGKQVEILTGLPTYQETLHLMDDASAEIRETAHNLMPKVLHAEGLHAALQTFCQKFNNQQQLTVNFQSYGEPVRFNRYFELLVYRTVQELINNSVKHASASSIIVQLSFDNDLFSVTVEDDGSGFNIESWQQADGLGISTLQQRMRAFNGNTDIQSSGDGTVVYISFELNQMMLNTAQAII